MYFKGNSFCDKTMDRNEPMKLLLLQPIRSRASAATHVSIIFCGMHVIGQTGPACPADSCVARRERSRLFIHAAASLTVVCNVCFYVRVFADFWEVLDIVACIHTCYIVAYHPDTVYLLFVCETDRYKPVKYGRIGVD